MKQVSKNVIVGQSGGPTAVINSSLVGVYKTAKDRGANKVYGMLYGIQGLLEEKLVDLSEHIQNDLDIELLKRTPSSFLGSCRYRLPAVILGDPTYEKIFALLNDLEIGYFFYIGGNDSMDTIQKLSEYGALIQSDIRFMGVPKTIDNDLAETDHTPGFGSAAKYIGSITKEVIRDGLVYDVPSITILEIMGRNAGWLTASAALAKCEDCEGPDLIYLPEVPFDMKSFTSKVENLQTQKKAIVIAVSEGIQLQDGRYVCELRNESPEFIDAFGHRSLTGTARYLADELANRLGCKTRAIEFATLQRCASHIASRVDITEAFQVGGAAVKAAFEGETGKMVALKRVSDDPYMCITETCDIQMIANVEKKVPRTWINETGDYVTEELLSYIKPLIQAELTPIMVDGLPRHLNIFNQRLTQK
nr:6-phosphofructokinase [uncultured Cellulosilyticum sp.]